MTSTEANPSASAAREPWTFTARDGEQLTLDDAVYQALGGASACWENLAGAGVFDSDRAQQIGDALLEFLRPLAAAGYAEAVARLRDDQRYLIAVNEASEVHGRIRHHLADYLETVGPDPSTV